MLLTIIIFFPYELMRDNLSRRSLGSGTRLETVLESSRDMLQISHSTGTGSSSSLGLSGPVERSSLSSWITTGGTGLLLNMERTTTTSVTQSMRFVMTLTERRSTLCLK